MAKSGHGHEHKPGKHAGHAGEHNEPEMLSPINAPKGGKGSPESPETMGLPPFENVPDPLGICHGHKK